MRVRRSRTLIDMPSCNLDYSDPNANPLPILAVQGIWLVICRLLTSSFEHAMLLWGFSIGLAGFLLFAYALVDVTLHPYYGPREAPAAQQRRRAAERVRRMRYG